MSTCLKQNILNLDSRVPRYTSYPTAPHFKALEDPSLLQATLANLGDDAPLSLYIHIPFCPKMCWYCGCNTKVTKRYAPIAYYMRVLCCEIESLATQLGHTKPVSHIHFGGGSPSYLRAKDFSLIMDHLERHFNILPDADIAIEIDPRNVNEARVAAYARHGVNRISLGVQDFDRNVLDAVNRPQPYSLSYKAVQLFREYGINGINLDLIYGLPHQTCETMKRTVELALTLDPQRIALFGYAHVPWMKKHMRLIDEGTLPDKGLRYDLFVSAAYKIMASGYNMIGIDHFAKPDDPLSIAADQGKLHRNFQGYTTDDAKTLLGLGVSAISKLEDMYVQNSPDMPVYREAIANGFLPAHKYCPISDTDKIRAYIIERLMCDFTVDLPAMCKRSKLEPSVFTAEMEQLKTFEKLGFITIENGTITILPDAKLMARSICAVFDSYLQQTGRKHAKAI